MADKVKWEMLHSDRSEWTERLEVPGGWLYKATFLAIDEYNRPAVALAFVPVRPGDSEPAARGEATEAARGQEEAK